MTDPDEDALDAKLREAFRSVALPGAPASVGFSAARLSAGKDPSPTRRGAGLEWVGALSAFAVALAVIAALVLTRPQGSGGLTGTTPPATNTPAATATIASAEATPQGSTSTTFLLPGQVQVGPGWRLIAAGVGMRVSPGPMDGPHQIGIETYSAAGLDRLPALLHLPPDAPTIDHKTEAAILIDMLAGFGPVCGQIRLDGLDFDQATRTLTVRYSDASVIRAAAGSPYTCGLDGTPAAILLAVAGDHVMRGAVSIQVSRFDGSSWDVVAQQSGVLFP